MKRFLNRRNIRSMKTESVEDPHEILLSLVDIGSLDADEALLACVKEMSDAECKRVLSSLSLPNGVEEVEEPDVEADDDLMLLDDSDDDSDTSLEDSDEDQEAEAEDEEESNEECSNRELEAKIRRLERLLKAESKCNKSYSRKLSRRMK